MQIRTTATIGSHGGGDIAQVFLGKRGGVRQGGDVSAAVGGDVKRGGDVRGGD